MPSRANEAGPVSERVKDVLRKGLANGWSKTRVAHEMNTAGHDWTENVVRGLASTGQNSRSLTVDEAVALLGVFKADARAVTREIDKIAADIEKGHRR